MRGCKRKIIVELIEKKEISNARLAEYFANKYRERKMNNASEGL